MGLKVLNSDDLPGWQNNLHFVSVCKKRKHGFRTPQMLERVKELFLEKAEEIGIHVHAVSVAYNHIHILVNTNGLDHSEIAKRLNGYSSKQLRDEFPELKSTVHPTALWGGKACRAIVDEKHFNHAMRYVQDHQPDNTKIPGDWSFDPKDE